jgi:metal-sulfur cluster biosynthetic enzyme
MIDGVTDVAIDLVWDPPWSPERMSEAARLELNL